MAILECRSCGHIVAIDHIDQTPQACPACGLKTIRIAARPEEFPDDFIERIIETLEQAAKSAEDSEGKEGDE
jgi:DNA-directed RNA polymerase subunit RPC12/RpoP